MKKARAFLDEILILPVKNKLEIGGLLFFAFIVGFFVTIFYWRIKASRPLPKKEAPVSFAQKEPALASLTLVPESQTVNVGDSFLVTVNLKTGDLKVDTVDVVLSFDPNLLVVEKIAPGEFFSQYPIQKAEFGKVSLTGTIGISGIQAGGVKGQGNFGTITFRTLKEGSARIYFDKEKTLATCQGENALGEVIGGAYEITL